MVEVTRFLEVMSVVRHDFLNHLQVISGLIQLNKTDRVKEYIRHVSLEIEWLSRVARLAVPEVAAFLTVANFLADKYQVKVLYDINTNMEHCTVPGDVLAEVLEEAFKQSMACLVPPDVSNRQLKISITQSDKKYYLKIFFPEPPLIKVEAAQARLADASQKMAPYGGKVGVAVSGSGGEIFIIFPYKPPEQNSFNI